jgi:hypothetical protein
VKTPEKSKKASTESPSVTVPDPAVIVFCLTLSNNLIGITFSYLFKKAITPILYT